MKGSEFHGTLNTTCGVSFMAACLEGSPITRWGNGHGAISSSKKQLEPQGTELSQSWCTTMIPWSPAPYRIFNFEFCSSFFLSDFSNGFELSSNQK